MIKVFFFQGAEIETHTQSDWIYSSFVLRQQGFTSISRPSPTHFFTELSKAKSEAEAAATTEAEAKAKAEAEAEAAANAVLEKEKAYMEKRKKKK